MTGWVSRAAALSVGCLLLAACAGEVRPSVTAGLDSCAQCNMVIDQLNQACGFVRDGHFVTFDSIGCLLASYDGLRRGDPPPPTEIYVADYLTAEFVKVEETVILLTRRIPTVMGSGALCFVTRDGAEATRTADDEELTDWLGFRRLRGEPDAVAEIAVTPGGLVPEIIDVGKGDLVLLRLDGGQLAERAVISVRGYPEIGDVSVGPGAEPTELRFFAVRPGAGFPVLGPDGEALGMIRVTGAHTADEEAM